MRLALQALFCKEQGSSEEYLRRRARIENELRNNAQSAEFFRRIRQIVSTPLRKAPEVFADESFPDANIVAEYLDCQLESSEISDEYERVCRESEEILAEVADCYDVLNNRLPLPMSPPKNCRNRLYYVAWEDEPPLSSKGESKKTSPSNDERVYDAEYTTSCSSDASVDVKINRPRMQKNPEKETARRNSRKNEVQLKISSQKPRRKIAKLWIKACLGLIIVAGSVNGFAKWRNLERSQTLDIQSPRIAQESDSVAERNEVDASWEDSGADVVSENEYITINDERATTGVENYSLSVAPELEPARVASLPNQDVAMDSAMRADNATEENQWSRRGLEPSNGGTRAGIEIPVRNNDVFSNANPQRF